MSDAFVRAITRRFAELEAEVEDLRRRIGNMVREARVTGVDYDRAVATVDMDGLPSKAIPWVQRAGDIRDWDPPTPGERVLVVSPTGDPGLGLILPGGWSTAFPQPHNRGGDRYIVAAGTITLISGDTSLCVGPSGVRIDGRLHTTRGIHDNGGVYSTEAVWPPIPTFTPPVR
ncbi:phage baseplate assembly protein V [Roseospira goensis]|uniref:Phage baseplate assembly protein gpV n=1 Tax=Roseospira goensis TaxID=391922 RepID=A0A7W6WM85_9PROT|nr:phage baseplate assembly protein V [Roseospira goensis]MBB4287669.1 phage baseplate assembly protein gpV [Roseospira goensis]